MSYATREGLQITPEATPGVFQTGATPLVMSLTSGNAFPNRFAPNFYMIRDVGGSNRPVATGAGTFDTKLKFSTPLWYQQAKVLLPYWLTPAGTPLELPTFTVDHYQMLEASGGTVIYERYLGCMGSGMSLKASNQGDGVILHADFDFVAMSQNAAITASDFPEPALTGYPWSVSGSSLAIFQHLAGHVTLNNTARTGFKSFSFSCANTVVPIYDESPTPQANTWRGRDVKFSFDLRHKSATDRTNFLAVSAQICSAAITDGTNTMTFDFKGNNIIQSVKDETPLNGPHYQGIEWLSLVTPGAGTDFTFSQAP